MGAPRMLKLTPEAAHEESRGTEGVRGWQHGAFNAAAKETLGIHNAVSGEQCVAAGNMLANPGVIEAMVTARCPEVEIGRAHV